MAADPNDHTDAAEIDVPSGGSGIPSTRPYNPARDRERARKWLAQALLFLVAGEIIAFLVFAALWPESREFLLDLVSLVFPATIAFASAATGFYFGSESK